MDEAIEEVDNPLYDPTAKRLDTDPGSFAPTQKKHKGVLKNLKKVRKNIPLKVVKNTHNGGKIV